MNSLYLESLVCLSDTLVAQAHICEPYLSDFLRDLQNKIMVLFQMTYLECSLEVFECVLPFSPLEINECQTYQAIDDDSFVVFGVAFIDQILGPYAGLTVHLNLHVAYGRRFLFAFFFGRRKQIHFAQAFSKVLFCRIKVANILGIFEHVHDSNLAAAKDLSSDII